MKHVTYISAGAGSGKTYTLTSILAHLIATGKAEPEQFILTTFTEKAAAEFKEKAKAKLYENSLGYGQYAQAAERLDQAMIGTIDSVAYSFVQKYWYLLSISPNLKIIDDDQKKFFISQMLSNLASKEETEFLVDFCSQFNIGFEYNFDKYGLNFDFWKDDVKTIFEKAKSYRINDFEESRKRSQAFVDEICGEWNLNYDRENILAFIEEVRNIATTQGMKNNIVLWDSIFSRKEKFHQLSSFYSEIASYADAKKGEKVKIRDLNLYQPVCDSLSHIYTSRQVKEYITKYVTLIFDYAQKCQREFDEYKDKHHLIDFIDMETKFLELLKMPQVQEDIRLEYKYVFVDEFQDSSPIQVEIFDRLSEIVGSDTEDDLIIPAGEVNFHTHNSIWVGDFKQAIYGFRGADTDLTKAVADIIAQKEKTAPKEYKIETLKDSHRSLEDIVNFTNEVFVPAFNGVLEPEQVRLNPIHGNPDKIQSLKFWSIAGSNKDKRMKSLAAQIAARLKDGEAPSDYAVLARGNSILDDLSRALKELNVPVFRELSLGESRDELTLVSALLKLVINNKDNYSRAVVAFLTQEGFTAGSIIDSKLEFNQAYKESVEKETEHPKYLPDNPVLKEFDANLSFYKAQTIHNLVESLITGLDLYSIAKCWESTQGSDEAFQAIIEASYAYEENCTQTGIAPTIYGFIDFAAENAVSAGSKDGVTLDTFHGAKGLEWKNVILLSLDKDDDDVKNFIKYDIFGVQNYHLNPPTEKELYPPMIINLFPSLFTGNTNINGELQEKIVNCSRYNSIHEHSDSETV